MNRAVFLDRDGTIIKDRGDIRIIKKIEFYEYTFNCLRELQYKFFLFIVTNQSGINKGVITNNEIIKIHSFILQRMNDNGVEIKEIYCCPHKEEELCSCRKPNSFFLEQAKKKYLLNLTESYVIGDHPSDMELAINSKANGIFLLTGHGRKHSNDLNTYNKDKIKVCRNLYYATKTILKLNK